jgi:hypothetical protein
MTTKTIREYDLNIFYAEDYDVDTAEESMDEFYTVQPSVYQEDASGNVTRQYLEAFKLSLEETRAIAPDFPEEEYGTDFFMGLEFFYQHAKAIPGRVRQILSTLPPVDEVTFENAETKWLDPMFV